jgi:hypothetical protein
VSRGLDDLLTPEQFIGRAPWRFAKTMPDQPHEYTVRGETPDEEFHWFVLYIREHHGSERLVSWARHARVGRDPTAAVNPAPTKRVRGQSQSVYGTEGHRFESCRAR